MVSPTDINLVIVHGHCPDGFGSAWAAWRLLRENAQYVFMRHGEEPPDVTGKVVGIFDFSFPRAVLEEMKTKAKDLILIDHHASAAKQLGNLDYCHFDMSHSGCVLAWKFFHPNEEVPKLLLHVEDRDLGAWKLFGSDFFLSYLDSIPCTFESWNRAWVMTLHGMDPAFRREGGAINRFKDVMVNDAVARAMPAHFSGYDMMVVNEPSRFLASKVASTLAENSFGVSMVYRYDHAANESYCSLRSTKESGIDVSEIASAYGGGGHPKAAAFRIRGLVTNHCYPVGSSRVRRVYADFKQKIFSILLSAKNWIR